MSIVKRDAELFLEVSGRLLEQGYRVRFRAGGTSMQPAISDGDALILGAVAPVAVRPGDILLYRKQQRGIAHRVVQVQHAEETVVAFLLRGDATPACDTPVEPTEVLGKVVAVEQGDRVDPNTRRARLARFVRTAGSRLKARSCLTTGQKWLGTRTHVPFLRNL